MDCFDFLETLPGVTLDRLYEDAWTCQAVFQSLPSLAQQFVMRLLACENSPPISHEFLTQWLLPTQTGKQKFQQAMDKLLALRVFLPTNTNPTASKQKSYQLHKTFQKQLKHGLSNLGGSPWDAGRMQLSALDKSEILTEEEVERQSRARWDSVLHFMVGSTAVREPPVTVVDMLERTGLMQPGVDQRSLHITDRGYEFMLRDVHVQMWFFMLEYIKTVNKLPNYHEEDILQFLFQLSYCETNGYYAVHDLTETQQMLLNDFMDFGLLIRKNANSKRFYTTSLAVNLIFAGATGQKKRASRQALKLTHSFDSVRAGVHSQLADPRFAPSTDIGSQLLIVVETNFKIYAYTNSSLHVAMLSVFVDIVARLPNLAVGFITRESLRSALIHGISAQQIYDFLMKHVHPKMRHNTPIIPENIADQIYLWERERNRVQFIEGILFDGFNTKEEFEQVRVYADDLNVLTWYDPIHFKMTISSEGIDNVRHFIQTNLQYAAAS